MNIETWIDRPNKDFNYFINTYRNGQHCAVELSLVEAAPPAYVQGIVCSLKESFGFIERADKVNEVCFIHIIPQTLKYCTKIQVYCTLE